VSARILVVEDDPSIRLGLEDTLRSRGHRVAAVGRGGEALERAQRERFDLVILDIMLPDLDGFEVCRRLRESEIHAATPIIMLSARGAELDRVRGFELGADDYVTKPFSLMELLARVQVALRRTGRGPGAEPDLLVFGEVEIDFARQRASKAGRPLDLPSRAFAILRVFARHPGEVVTREQLLEEAWGIERTINTRTVDNHIVKLRRALEDAPERPHHLVTVHGAGYRLIGVRQDQVEP
jgi:DNA-binding response OmpR family regulator